MGECQPTVDNVTIFLSTVGAKYWENKTVVLPFSFKGDNLATVFASRFSKLNLKELVIGEPAKNKVARLTKSGKKTSTFSNWAELQKAGDVMVTFPRNGGLDAVLNWCETSGKDWFVWGSFYGVYHKYVFPHFATNEWRWLYNEAFNYQEDGEGNRVRIASRWYTNTLSVKKSQLKLQTMEENLNWNPNLRRELAKRGAYEYPYFDLINVLFVPTVDSIPSDYYGLMAVPMTVFDKWNDDLLECMPVTTPYRNRGKDFRPFRHILNGKMTSQHVLLALKSSLCGVS